LEPPQVETVERLVADETKGQSNDQPNQHAISTGKVEVHHYSTRKAVGATRWFYREVTRSFFSLAFAALKRVSSIEKLIRRV